MAYRDAIKKRNTAVVFIEKATDYSEATYGIILKDSVKVRNCCFLNLRKTSPNPSLKVGNVKPVSTSNFFGNSTWRKLGVNLALFFLKNGLMIPHKTG